MKVQITVDKHLWRKARVSALMRGQSLGELVSVALSDLLGEGVDSGLRAGGTNGDAQRGGSIPRSKTVKATLDVASESKNPAPSPKPVSEFLCKACGKPTKGEFLCLTCKKV